MHINRLRLIGFKSFVEPTDLLIERGLTGVVGPNGCGKSNLLEALRWVMGETSHKSMRAASMDDVIFNGTNLRPPRNNAEVTIQIDNKDRKAPAEFNAHESFDVTRRIEREAGSAYRINGKEMRARDVRILFEDAATGARSPALVRQGQIAEIVNAKPEQRRRILEDAAGIAGPAQPPARGGTAPAGGGRQPRAPQRHPGPAQFPDRKPEAPGTAGAALQGAVDRNPQARRHRAAFAVGGVAGACRERRGGIVDRARESGPGDRSRGQGLARRGGGGRATPAIARAGGRQGCCSASLQDRAGEPRTRGRAQCRAAPGFGGPRRAAHARPRARRGVDCRRQGNHRPPRRRDGVACQYRQAGGGLRAQGAGRLRRGRRHPKGRRDAARRGHHGRGRGAGAPAERRGSAAGAPGACAEARAAAHRARIAGARDRRACAGCLQAEGDRGGRPAAHGGYRRDRAADRCCRSCGPGRCSRRSRQERTRSRSRVGCRAAQDRGGDTRQASEADRRQRPAACAGSHQGGLRVRAGAGGSARRRSGCTCRCGCAGTLVAQCRFCARPGAGGRRGAACSACCSSAGAGAAAYADRRRAARGWRAAAASAQAGPASGVGGGRPVALGRLCRGRAGRHCRGEPIAGAQPPRDPCRAGGRAAPRRRNSARPVGGSRRALAGGTRRGTAPASALEGLPGPPRADTRDPDSNGASGA